MQENVYSNKNKRIVVKHNPFFYKEISFRHSLPINICLRNPFFNIRTVGIYTIPKHHFTDYHRYIPTNSRNLHYSKTPDSSRTSVGHLRIVGIYTIPKPQIILDYHPAV